MPLIDSTYFENSNIIANVSEPDPDYKTDKVLDLMILKGERDVLSFAFGIEMWEDFKTFITDGIAPGTPQNYMDIIKGKIYEKQGKKCYWKGLVQEDTKESLLADYVYCLYNDDNNSTSTGIGEVAINSKIGYRASIVPKVTKVWNRFIRTLQAGVRDNPSGFTMEGKPYWIVNGGVDYYGINTRIGEVSLVQFLLDNKSDYPLYDDNYRRFGELKNEFGI